MMICPRCSRQFPDDVEECPDDGTRLRSFQDQTSQLLGRILDGRWEIVDKIGEGGMGEVYRARQTNVDRTVAVKVLRLALASTEEYVARFFREADIAMTVQHPHFVAIYDFGQSAEDQLLYIAMELLEGKPLSGVLRERRPGLLEILEISKQVCAAMAAAHEARIVHRDLKPDNIFLLDVPEGGPFVKVLDFGIAKSLDAEKVTRTGQLFGTPEYMSPEQCEGGSRVDGRSDLYALGCIMYELLTGRSPFKRDSIIQTLLAQVSEKAKPFSELGIPVPGAVADTVWRLLEKHPDNRFSSAMEARTAIETAISRLSLNSAELRAYETVANRLAPRSDAAKTVSYSDLGNPLQLEGVLAQSAKSALAKQAEKRRAEESEQDTVDSGGARPKSLPLLVLLLIVLLSVAATAGWIVVRERESSSPAPPVGVDAIIATQDAMLRAFKAARTAVASEDAADASEALARDLLVNVRVMAETASAASGKPPARKPADSAKSRSNPNRALLDIRTQSSVRVRFMGAQRDFLACYDRREKAEESGTVRFVLQIEPDGRVSDARVSSQELKSPAALACMKDVAQKVQFAKAEHATKFEKNLTFARSPPAP